MAMAVVPTLVLIDFRDDGVPALRKKLVHETAILLVENLTLPADQVYELGLDWREDGAGRDDDGALAVPPSGMSPAGLFLYSSSSSFCDIFIRFGTVSCGVVTDMVILLH